MRGEQMSAAVLIVSAIIVAAIAAIVVRALLKVIADLQTENKRLVAIITAPTPTAAHAAALDRPRTKERDDERPVPPVGA